MKSCVELIYDRYNLDFFSEDGIDFKLPMQCEQKMLYPSDVVLHSEKRILSVGHYLSHSDGKIRANDTVDNITTQCSEETEGYGYKVTAHFEFQLPTYQAVSLCKSLDAVPFHMVISRFDMSGKPTSVQIVRGGVGQSRVMIREASGIIQVDIEIRCMNGIQYLLSSAV